MQFIDGVDVPVLMQRRGLQSWTTSFTCPLRPTTGAWGLLYSKLWSFRRCTLRSAGAVHRRLWTSLCSCRDVSQARRVATTRVFVQAVQNTVRRYTVAVLLHRDRARSANCTEDRSFRGAVLGWSLTCPLVCQRQAVVQTVLKTVALCSDAGREKGRILRHFWIFYGDFLEPLMAHSFYYMFVECRWVALTPGVGTPGCRAIERANLESTGPVVFR